jgi:hypothetical protein
MNGEGRPKARRHFIGFLGFLGIFMVDPRELETMDIGQRFATSQGVPGREEDAAAAVVGLREHGSSGATVLPATATPPSTARPPDQSSRPPAQPDRRHPHGQDRQAQGLPADGDHGPADGGAGPERQADPEPVAKRHVNGRAGGFDAKPRSDEKPPRLMRNQPLDAWLFIKAHPVHQATGRLGWGRLVRRFQPCDLNKITDTRIFLEAV